MLVGCLTSQQHASVSQGRICSDKLTCCHTVVEVADQTFYFSQSQYTHTGPTSPSADPVMTGAWQGSHCSVNFYVTAKSLRKRDSNVGSYALEADAVTCRPMRRLSLRDDSETPNCEPALSTYKNAVQMCSPYPAGTRHCMFATEISSINSLLTAARKGSVTITALFPLPVYL